MSRFAPRIDLASDLGLPAPLPDPPRQVIEAALRARGAVRLDTARWRDLHSGASGGDPLVDPLVAVLDGLAPGATFELFHTTFRERHGGRRYAFYTPEFVGAVALSHRAKEKLQHPRRMFINLPRRTRSVIRPLPGYTFIDVDIHASFLAIAAALTRDPALLRDLARDIHQVVGDAAQPGLAEAPARRAFGKVMNSSLVGGRTPYGLAKEFETAGFECSGSAAEQWWWWWWHRYPEFRSWVDRALEVPREAAHARCGLTIQGPTRQTRFSPAEVRGWYPGTDTLDPAAGERTVVSSYFRAVEGAILDQALFNLASVEARHGLRLVLPAYDGLLAEVPDGVARWGAEHAEWAMQAALQAFHVTSRATVKTGPSWGELEAR